jgi:hypothetical protein
MVAARLRAQGYEVTVLPTGEQLPPFLQRFRPDLVARRGDDHVVVEIKRRTSGKSGAEVSQLAEVISNQPNWRFELVLAGSSDPAWDPPEHLPEPRIIAAGLVEVESLSSAGSSNAALLLAWSLLEGAARHRLVLRGVDPSERMEPTAILERLVHEGDLDDTEFERLRAVLSLRNAVAHGFVDQRAEKSQLDTVTGTTRKLLGPVARAA